MGGEGFLESDKRSQLSKGGEGMTLSKRGEEVVGVERRVGRQLRQGAEVDRASS